MRVILACALLLAVSTGGCLNEVFGGGSGPGPKDFVSAQTYTKWIIEIDTVQGMAAPQAAMDTLLQRLQSVANKPDGIEFRYDDTLPARGGSWSLEDVMDYSSAHQELKSNGKTVVLHLLLLDGNYEGGGTLGVAVSTERNGKVVSTGPIAIFSQAIRDGCGPVCLSGTTPAFRTVLVHEFGHAMGLVNNGAPMQTPHEDPQHPGHSNNRNSVMWWEAETNGLFNLAGGPPDNFDANDRADLCALGGKC